MSDARDRILAKVRKGIGRDQPTTATEAQKARDHGFGSELPPRPLWDTALLDHFTERFLAAAGTVDRVDGNADAAAAILAYLRERDLAATIRIADHPLLADIPWPAEMQVDRTGPVADALVGVSVAVGALAETGTLVLYSGRESATELNFLPEYHIVLLREADVVGYMEDVWNLLRQRDGFPPRALNFITGPSRTADVEQTIQLGAHGPRSLHLILLKDDS